MNFQLIFFKRIRLERQEPMQGFFTLFDPGWYIETIAEKKGNSFLILPEINEKGGIIAQDGLLVFIMIVEFFYQKKLG